MISPVKEKLLIELSERKNTNDEHYKLITNFKDYDDSIASYLIDEIKNTSNVSRETFNINRRITQSPNYYVNLKLEEKKESENAWVNHYKRLATDKTLDLQLRSIAYMTLYERKELLDFELDEGLEKYLLMNGVELDKQD